MRSTLNSIVVDFRPDQATNYSRIAGLSLITGIHLSDLENALYRSSEGGRCGTTYVKGGGINHVVECIAFESAVIRFRVYNRYEITDRPDDTPCIL